MMRRGPLLLLAGALALLFHRLLLGDIFFWGLPSLQFIPWRDYALDVLRSGDLPLWNPYNGAGAPLFANYQSALFYPPNWASFVLPLAWSMSVLAVLHLFLAGWGMWRFTRWLGLPLLGRGVSALVFGMTGYLVARLGTYPMVSAAAWLPWLLWAAHGVLNGQRRSAAWLALFTGLLLLAGHAQTAWYSLLLVALYALWGLLRERRAMLRRVIVLGLVVALGAGIAALQLLATAELLRTSQRSTGVDFDFAMNFSYGPARILNLISPNVFGTPADGTYLVQGFYFEYAVYIGLIPLISALAAVIAWWRSRRQSARLALLTGVPFWIVIVLVAFVFALGNFTPVFPFLYEKVPTFSLFQAPVRWHLWTVFGLSVLAGIGVTVWPRGYRVRRWTRRALAAALGMVILSLMLMFMVAVPAAGAGGAALTRALFATGLLAALACWLTLRQPEREHQRYGRWGMFVLLVIAADLVWAWWGLNPTVPGEFIDAGPPPPPGYARGYWPDAAEEQIKFDELFRVDDYRVAAARWPEARLSALPNLNLLDRLYLLDNFDPLLPGPYAEYMDLIDQGQNRGALLQAANVGYVYSGLDAPLPPLRPAARAWLVRSVCWHASSPALNQALLDSDWNPLQQAHMLGDGGCPPPETAVDAGNVLVGDDGNRVQIDVRAPFDGWLVLADVDYPGWTAELDGRPVPIYRGNLAFRAVQVPPGDHQVTFTYWPSWLLPGAAISLVCLLITLGLFGLKDTHPQG